MREVSRPDAIDKLRKMLAFLEDTQAAEELRPLATWKAHLLTRDRKWTRSLSVTGNRRLTFRVDSVESEVWGLDLEDYH